VLAGPLLFVLLAHQVFMVMPDRLTATPPVAAAQETDATMPCGGGACPPAVIQACFSGGLCVTAQASLTRLPGSVVFLLLTLLIVLVSALRVRPSPHHEPWHRPPDRQQALLQVFLI